MKKTVKSFRIDPWVDNHLESFFQKHNVTATELINYLLENYFMNMVEQNICDEFEFLPTDLDEPSKDNQLDLHEMLSEVV
ncbi:hypothetical protein J7J00_17680 [Bacillus sp. ISL-4]|uniref:hypothetical protein n=1 Tax=Bacillus sp. ISL-4 TaxID=2819125 RepID=UPI001BED2225|nr:hypothetical protein [Bacillus sp. ISL-4]MBT2667313.1 hypothetical protein [Bacillus sp. ISL-4]MBT2674189.1 hypothetical protein [Streptomyces sp. ISL-14]